MKKTIITLRFVAGLLIVFQLLGYIGNKGFPAPAQGFPDMTSRIAYIIGYNLVGLFGLILLLIAWWLKKKLNRKKDRDLIDSIGRDQ